MKLSFNAKRLLKVEIMVAVQCLRNECFVLKTHPRGVGYRCLGLELRYWVVSSVCDVRWW